MMGKRTVAQEALFYSFNLERLVPADLVSRRQRKMAKLIPTPANPAPA